MVRVRQCAQILKDLIRLIRRLRAQRSQEMRRLRLRNPLPNPLVFGTCRLVARGQTARVVPGFEKSHERALDLAAAPLQSPPLLGNLARVLARLTVQAVPTRENADSGEGCERALPVGPHRPILQTHPGLVGHDRRRRVHRRDNALTPAAFAEIVLRGVLNLALDRQRRGDVLTEIGADLSVRGRYREDEVAVRPFVAVARDPLGMLRARILQRRLVQVVIRQVVRGQDDEVGGTQEADPLQDDAEWAAVDALEAAGFVADLHNGWDEARRRSGRLRVFVCCHRQPSGREEDQNGPQHDTQETADIEPSIPGILARGI